MCVSFIIIITIKCIIIVSRRDFKDMKQIAIYIRQAKKWRLSDYGNKTQQSPNVGQRTSELDSSEFVSFLLMQNEKTRKEGSRNPRAAKFLTDGIWRPLTHEYIAQKKDFFCTVNHSSVPCQPPKAPVFDVSEQWPWPLARGDANELG